MSCSCARAHICKCLFTISASDKLQRMGRECVTSTRHIYLWTVYDRAHFRPFQIFTSHSFIHRLLGLNVGRRGEKSPAIRIDSEGVRRWNVKRRREEGAAVLSHLSPFFRGAENRQRQTMGREKATTARNDGKCRHLIDDTICHCTLTYLISMTFSYLKCYLQIGTVSVSMLFGSYGTIRVNIHRIYVVGRMQQTRTFSHATATQCDCMTDAHAHN